MFDRILLPVGTEPPGERLLEPVVEMVDRFDAELHLLHVVDSEMEAMVRNVGGPDETTPGEQAINDIRNKLSQRDIRARSAREKAEKAYLGVLEYIQNHDIDLILMPTHGRSGLSRFFLGSTTERVLRQSSVPVMTLPVQENN